jgi:hypothetical protein
MFTLRTLLLVVMIAALGAGAVMYRSPIVSSLIVSLTVFVLAVFTLRIWSRPTQRSFSVPAALFGWLYFALAFVQPLSMRPHLVTSRLIFEGWFRFSFSENYEAFEHEGFKEAMYESLIGKGTEVWTPSGRTQTVFELWRIYAMLQALISLAVAIMAGAVCHYVMIRPVAAQTDGDP